MINYMKTRHAKAREDFVLFDDQDPQSINHAVMAIRAMEVTPKGERAQAIPVYRARNLVARDTFREIGTTGLSWAIAAE